MVSINFLRDVGIGALQQVESNRLAQNKRISEREKEERERKKRLAEIGLTGKLAMEREVLSSETSIKTAEISAASRKSVAANKLAKEKAKALLAESEKYSDWDFASLFKIKLPKGLKYNSDFINNHSKNSTGRIEEKVRVFNNAVKYAYRNTDKGQTDEFKAHIQKELKNMIIGGRIYVKRREAISGDEIGGNFDFKTGTPFLYNMFEGTDFQKEFLNGPPLSPYKLDVNVEEQLRLNPQSVLNIRLSKQPIIFNNSTINRLTQLGDPNDLVNKASVGAFRGTDTDKRRWIDSIKKLNSPVKYNKNDPSKQLDSFAVISAVSFGAGSGAVTTYAGQKTSRIVKPKRYDTRIKENSDKHTEAKTVLNDIIALQRLGKTLNKLGMPKLKVIKDLTTTITGIIRSFIVGTDEKGITLSEEQIASLSEDGEIVSGLDAHTYFNSLKDASNKRLKSMIDTDEYKTLTPEQKTERYAAAVQWEARTIQLVYKIAKMVQGGSGGQAVSNADFKAVLSSFQSGMLGSREGTLHVFDMMQSMVEREYLYSKIMSDEVIITGARNVADSAIRMYKLYHDIPEAGGAPISVTDDAATFDRHGPVVGTPKWEALSSTKQLEVLQKRRDAAQQQNP